MEQILTFINNPAKWDLWSRDQGKALGKLTFTLTLKLLVPDHEHDTEEMAHRLLGAVSIFPSKYRYLFRLIDIYTVVIVSDIAFPSDMFKWTFNNPFIDDDIQKTGEMVKNKLLSATHWPVDFYLSEGEGIKETQMRVIVRRAINQANTLDHYHEMIGMRIGNSIENQKIIRVFKHAICEEDESNFIK